MSKILVIRLSAIGDAAMTIPVIYSVAKANPEDSFTVLTQKFLLPVFINRPLNVDIIGMDISSTEKSLFGLLRFISKLIYLQYDMVIDLHDVIRSKIIRFFFHLYRKPVFKLDKARKDRKKLSSLKHKVLKPLRPVTVRYADVFREAGFKFSESFTSLYDDDHPVDLSDVSTAFGIKKGRWIGIAPFAKHQGKIYPLDDMEQVLARLCKEDDLRVFLFGAKGYEEAILSQWAFRYKNVDSVVGRFSLDSELALMSQLDVFLCMDSANMHFASLVGTRVISVWGATHPYAGFYGYNQNPDDVIQETLSCRPCSIYGNKPCARGDWACMTKITPKRILAKILEVFQQKSETLQ